MRLASSSRALGSSARPLHTSSLGTESSQQIVTGSLLSTLGPSESGAGFGERRGHGTLLGTLPCYQPSNSTEVLKSASVDTRRVVQGHRTLLGAELEAAQVGINHKASLGPRKLGKAGSFHQNLESLGSSQQPYIIPGQAKACP